MRYLKIVLAVTIFIVSIIFLVNLVTLAGEGKCRCSLCAGSCVLENIIPPECPPMMNYSINCQKVSCKHVFGRCFELPKVLDFSFYFNRK